MIDPEKNADRRQTTTPTIANPVSIARDKTISPPIPSSATREETASGSSPWRRRNPAGVKPNSA
jgi:hypothetical protein